LGRIDVRAQVNLAPGYRSDVLVKAPDVPGEYLLTDLRTTGAGALRAGFPEPEDVIARVIVRGPENPMSLPDAKALAGLAPYPDITAVQKTRTLTFGGAGSVWKVNGVQFDPARTDHCPVLG